MSDILIPRQEELCLEILAEVTTKVREDQGLPTSDSLLVLAEGMARGGGRDKRERSHTVNSVGGGKKKSK